MTPRPFDAAWSAPLKDLVPQGSDFTVSGGPQAAPEQPVCGRDLVVVIPAHDEAAALRPTLAALARCFPYPGRVHVIADHCRDATAEVAASAGVRVHVHSGEQPLGKGAALSWWVERTCGASDPNQLVVVIDADSQVDRSFFKAIIDRMDGGESVVQARVVPLLTSTSRISALAALSEIAEQSVFERLRSLLGWPARLRGTGMAFRRKVLAALAPKLSTNSEDAELSVLLAAAGVRSRFAYEAIVLDPKPEDRSGAANQRSRWIKGQFQVVRAHPGEVGRLLLQGPPGWTLLAAIIAKPKSFFLPLHLALFLSLWSAMGSRSAITDPRITPLLIAVAIIAANLLALCYGIAQSNHRLSFALSMLALPLYLIMWLKSLVLALFPRERWPRSRPVLVEQHGREVSVAG